MSCKQLKWLTEKVATTSRSCSTSLTNIGLSLISPYECLDQYGRTQDHQSALNINSQRPALQVTWYYSWELTVTNISDITTIDQVSFMLRISRPRNRCLFPWIKSLTVHILHIFLCDSYIKTLRLTRYPTRESPCMTVFMRHKPYPE